MGNGVQELGLNKVEDFFPSLQGEVACVAANRNPSVEWHRTLAAMSCYLLVSCTCHDYVFPSECETTHLSIGLIPLFSLRLHSFLLDSTLFSQTPLFSLRLLSFLSDS